jgi:probable rRNA maturation factor
MPSAARRARPAPAIDILIESPLWRAAPGAAAVLRRAIGEAADSAGPPAGAAALAVVLCDDAAMRKLNERWRGRAEPTNVLSFPAVHATGMREHDPEKWVPVFGKDHAQINKIERDDESKKSHLALGDIAIAYETTAREAEADGKRFADHLAHLAVHGFLHLLGYDHQSDDEADAMERLERVILARLGIADPYAVGDSAT